MESEPRQNPLSKDETIEQLQTTIGKLETIIEQLNSTSVVNLSATNSVENLITTTEELENAISNLAEETIEIESETAITNEKITTDKKEVKTIPAQEPVVTSEPEMTAEETPTPEIKVPATSLSQSSATKASAKEKAVVKKNSKQSQSSTPAKKKKQKKNWLAIALLALIIAIIPISLKYLPSELTSKIFSKTNEEVIVQNTPDIIGQLPDNQLKIPKESPINNEVKDQVEKIDIIKKPQQIIENVAIKETSEPILEKTEVAVIEPITEEINNEESNNLDLEQSLFGEQETVIIALESDTQIPEIDKKLENIIVSDDFNLAEIEIATEAKSLLDSDVITDQKIDDLENPESLKSYNTLENTIESKPKIPIPENLVAETPERLLELKTLIHNVKLTPEQNLIALLSEKVLQLSQNYQDDIILSIEPNITNNILTVKIADDWYSLATTEQDTIVADMFARSQELEFRKLEIKDQNDNLVARSPVVGQNMIIFHRDS